MLLAKSLHMAFYVFLSSKVFLQENDFEELLTSNGKYYCPRSLMSSQIIQASANVNFQPNNQSYTIAIFTEFEVSIF